MVGWPGRAGATQQCRTDGGGRDEPVAGPGGPGPTQDAAGTRVSPGVLTSVTTSAISHSSIPITALCSGSKNQR
jgi:hypothetical protein